MKSMIISVIFMSSLSASLAHAEEFCARIRGVDYVKSGSEVSAFMYLDQVHGRHSHATLSNQSLKVTDTEAVFKIATVIAQLSIQNSAQLQQDLQNGQFEWYYLVGQEKHPNPYEEDFQVCVEADLSSVSQKRELSKVERIVDLLEDGHSVLDLLP